MPPMIEAMTVFDSSPAMRYLKPDTIFAPPFQNISTEPNAAPTAPNSMTNPPTAPMNGQIEGVRI